MAKAPQRTPAKPAPQQPAAPAEPHAFRGLRDPVEVFTAGTHTDNKGRKAAFTHADLDQMVANVTGAGVPAVLGHPKETDRAWAWAALERQGDSLLARFTDIDPDFEAAVDAGAYRERSISVYKDPARGWVPLHIGWLGAVPPALALKPLNYSAPAAPAGAETHEFTASASGVMDAGWALGDIARLLRGLRDWVISDKGLAVADQVLPDWTLTSVADAARRISDAAVAAATTTTGPVPMFNRGPTATGDPAMTTITEADLQRAREEAAAAAIATAASQFAAQGQELSELRAQRQTERIGVQIGAWKAAGKLLPAEESGLAEFMAALEGGTAAEFQFSAADKSTAKKTPAAWFADFMTARNAVVKLAAAAGGAAPLPGEPVRVDTQDYRAINRAADEYITREAAAGRVVTVAQAVVHVTTRPAA